jgi:hypothetical protein
MVIATMTRKNEGSGLRAPALLFRAALIAAALLAQPALAQTQSRQPRAVAAAPVPDELTLSKLLWSTMAAVDQANKTGNYSVLRDLGSTGFQANNNAASLAAVFAAIRTQRIDLSNTLLVAPTYEFRPAMIEPGILRMRGRFPLRPTAIGFDLIYEWQDGWRLHGVSIVPFGPSGAPPR